VTDTETGDPYDLARFIAAQNAGGAYESALAELRAGRKRGLSAVRPTICPR
jgi:uncharacterized protein (DUF1810 family)